MKIYEASEDWIKKDRAFFVRIVSIVSLVCKNNATWECLQNYEENNWKALTIVEMISEFDSIMRTHSINSRKENLLPLSLQRSKWMYSHVHKWNQN